MSIYNASFRCILAQARQTMHVLWQECKQKKSSTVDMWLGKCLLVLSLPAGKHSPSNCSSGFQKEQAGTFPCQPGSVSKQLQHTQGVQMS
jgi:hypothetical protein